MYKKSLDDKCRDFKYYNAKLSINTDDKCRDYINNLGFEPIDYLHLFHVVG